MRASGVGRKGGGVKNRRRERAIDLKSPTGCGSSDVDGCSV